MKKVIKDQLNHMAQQEQPKQVAYAERYLDATQELKLTASIDTIVPLNNSGPAFFANYDTKNSIDITQAGFYLISYFLSFEPKEDCTLKNIMIY